MNDIKNVSQEDMKGLKTLTEGFEVYTKTHYTDTMDESAFSFLRQAVANHAGEKDFHVRELAHAMAVFDNWHYEGEAPGLAQEHAALREFINMRESQSQGLLDPERLLAAAYEWLTTLGNVDMPANAETIRIAFDEEKVMPVYLAAALVTATHVPMDAWLVLGSSVQKKAVLLGWWMIRRSEPEGVEEGRDGE